MTTLPSPDRPAPHVPDQPVEPVPGPVTLAAVPDLPRIGPFTDHDRSADVNSAYPDTSYRHHTTREDRTAAVIRSAAAVEALVGVWLAVSPWVVGSGGSAVLRWNDVVVGALLAVAAAARLVRPSLPRTPSVSFGLGAWTIVAAFVLSFQNGATGTAPLWNAIACGAALTAAAAWSTTETERATLRRG
ncbi:MAG: hypothetical protein QOJ11_4436 [Frankiales bacterium]|nr:hypothetical protein [Frankiales bacterium]